MRLDIDEPEAVLPDLLSPAEALAIGRAACEETHTAIPYQVCSWLCAAEAAMAAAWGRSRPVDMPSIARSRDQPRPASAELSYLAACETHMARWHINCCRSPAVHRCAGIPAAVDAAGPRHIPGGDYGAPHRGHQAALQGDRGGLVLARPQRPHGQHRAVGGQLEQRDIVGGEDPIARRADVQHPEHRAMGEQRDARERPMPSPRGSG